MQWRTAAISGLVFCTVVCLLAAAAAPDGFRSNQARAVPANDAPRDTQNLSSLPVYDLRSEPKPFMEPPFSSVLREEGVGRQRTWRRCVGSTALGRNALSNQRPVAPPSHQQALKILDEFLSTHGERLITDPLKHAVLQRDLWAVFEWVSDPFYADYSKLNRTQLERKLAQVRNEMRGLISPPCQTIISSSFPGRSMARILAEKNESSFAPSHSFRRCTTFWRGTTQETLLYWNR